MHLLVDADSALYKAGFSNEERSWLVCDRETDTIIEQHRYKRDIPAHYLQDESVILTQHSTPGPLAHSISNLKGLCDSMLAIEHSSYEMFLTGPGNFRERVYEDYKIARRGAPKPCHFDQLKDWMIKRHQAVVVEGEEADDRVSWEQCTSAHETCIVAIDKDLLNTPGWNYNYDKQILKEISEEEANLNFGRQCLTGDPTDSIPGIQGIGPKRANKILPNLMPGWTDRIRDEYAKAYGEEGGDILLRNATLLWMRREPEQQFEWGLVE
jgi:DNA polymerase-1